MYNKDHLDGYHGRPRSVFTNNSEYERGQHASPSGAIGGGSFGAMFLALILAAAVFVLSYMLYFGLIALVGGLLLMLQCAYGKPTTSRSAKRSARRSPH